MTQPSRLPKSSLLDRLTTEAVVQEKGFAFAVAIVKAD
jgi:hypothetical protein